MQVKINLIYKKLKSEAKEQKMSGAEAWEREGVGTKQTPDTRNTNTSTLAAAISTQQNALTIEDDRYKTQLKDAEIRGELTTKDKSAKEPTHSSHIWIKIGGTKLKHIYLIKTDQAQPHLVGFRMNRNQPFSRGRRDGGNNKMQISQKTVRAETLSELISLVKFHLQTFYYWTDCPTQGTKPFREMNSPLRTNPNQQPTIYH